MAHISYQTWFRTKLCSVGGATLCLAEPPSSVDEEVDVEVS